MTIKVSGLRDGDNIHEVSKLGVDWIGMVFCTDSPRNVTMIPTHAGIIPDKADLSKLTTHQSPKRVGVFTDEMAQNIITRVVNFSLHFVQFDGRETPTLIRNLRRSIDPGYYGDTSEKHPISGGIQFIKTIHTEDSEGISACQQYEDCVDYFLFLLPNDDSDKQFVLNQLAHYEHCKPFLLGGDITSQDAALIRSFSHPLFKGVDLSTHFESSPAVIDVPLLDSFISQLR
ncbi:MAG: phosphoribosylanthranilate isomerase [Prevotella sp.]|nr:phosphoribosylanthranilate isomerase [Prevotella sp.]